MAISETLKSIGKRAHREWDDLVDRLNWGADKPVTTANYIGFGREDFLFLTGRVLRDRGIRRSERDDLLDNLVNNFKRFNSREIRGAEVEIRWGNHRFRRITDAEGYFLVEHQFAQDAQVTGDHDLWQEAEIEVVSTPQDGQVNAVFHADVVVPKRAAFGVISDIDDTILQTDVTSKLKLKMMLHTMLKNAGDRYAFSGVADFFQQLQFGPKEEGRNPFFYVSNSPWNLYDLLRDFLHLNHLPRGPVLLRDFGLPTENVVVEFRNHKDSMVRRILEVYPELPFILVGDSGEFDTDIYLRVARDYPGRILAIYIRDVQHERRAQRIRNLIEKADGVEIHLVADYAEASNHARKKGWIV
jgi:phosphatidate phosphatase APP1